MSKGGGGGGTTTVQKADPWSGVQPYLIGGSYTDPNTGQVTQTGTGIYPEAQKLYQNQGWTQGMTDLTGAQSQNVAGRSGQVQQAYGVGNQALNGGFDPNISRIGNTNGVGNISADQVRAMMVDPTQAFGSLGGANPTQSIQQMLTGRANTSTLDPVVNSALTRMSDNFNTQVLPGIDQGAVAAGQYGGSRQGIAQGLAMKGLSQSMGDTAANMYNNAYNTAQQNMYGTANNMAGLGLNNAQANANRDLTGQTTNAGNNLQAGLTNAANQMQTQQFNANLGLQNNTQAMQLAQQQLANRAQGLSLLGQGNQLQDQNYSQQMSLLDAPNQYNWNNMNKYASIVTPGAGIGGSSTSNQQTSTNPFAGALGGALGGAALAGALPAAWGVTSGMGALGGAAMALLSDRRFKTDIERVGTLDNGLGVYRYRYKSGGPIQIGVMADEVKAVNPGAVINVDGVDYVNYGGI